MTKAATTKAAMTAATGASVHASAVLVEDRAVLIRGPSGAGKSRLAFDLILAGRSGQVPKAVLVGDDRVHLDTLDGELLVRPAPELAGLIEIRGLGIRRCEYARTAIVGLVVDLSAPDAERLPAPETLHIAVLGIKIPRIAVPEGYAALPLIVAALTTTEGSFSASPSRPSADCPKGIGNHMKPTLATE